MKDLFKINKEKFKNHLHYGKWYYIAAIIVALFVVNVAHSVTAPRYPRESRVSIIMYGGAANDEVTGIWEKEMLELLAEDQREVEIISTVSTSANMEMVVVARMVANDDDIFVINSDEIETYASQGAFMQLDVALGEERLSEIVGSDDIEKYKIDVEGADAPHVYYLPLSIVDGFEEIGLSGENLSIAILSNSTNADNAIICLEYIMSR